jgi:uncharacterized protein YndB with AHSA1/START domain
MIQVECSTQVARPREEVFEYLTDVDKLPSWQSGVTSVSRVTQGPVGVGTQFRQLARVGPWKLDVLCTVTDVKINERYAFQARSTGPLDCDVAFNLQPVAGGTRLTVNGRAQLKGVFRLLRPMLAHGLRKETRQELETLRLIVEARRPVAV